MARWYYTRDQGHRSLAIDLDSIVLAVQEADGTHVHLAGGGDWHLDDSYDDFVEVLVPDQ